MANLSRAKDAAAASVLRTLSRCSVARSASFREIPAQPVATWHTAERHRRFRAWPSVDAKHEFFAPAPTRPQHRATEREVHRRVFLRRVEREGRLRPAVSADVALAHAAGQSSPMSSNYLICSRVRHRLGVPAPIFFRQCGNAIENVDREFKPEPRWPSNC